MYPTADLNWVYIYCKLQIANMPAATPVPPEMMGSVTEGKSEWKETAG